jgi:hypothetical protein
MSLQTNNRDFPEVGTAGDKVDYQRYEHPELDVLTFGFSSDQGSLIPFGKLYPTSVRIYCPDIRVVSRIACGFQPLTPDKRDQYDLSTLKNNIVAYRCMNMRSRIARVGEIVGKNGIPLEFPKSDIDGIAFQNEDDMPWIDIDMNLGFPGVAGTWSVFYHATSNNKLKRDEWRGYISRVTMHVQNSAGVVLFNNSEGG